MTSSLTIYGIALVTKSPAFKAGIPKALFPALSGVVGCGGPFCSAKARELRFNRALREATQLLGDAPGFRVVPQILNQLRPNI